MNKSLKKTISLLLLSNILILSIMGCENSIKDTKDDTTSQAKDTNISGETTIEDALDKLPTKDYNKYEFRILNIKPQDWGTAIMDVEAEDGDVVNDAIFKRNRVIEDKYNIKLAVQERDGIAETVKKSVRSGGDDFDAVFANQNESALLSREGIYLNLLDIPNLDLTKPWWDKAAVDTLTINDKLFFVTGDINLFYNDGTWVLMFNKSIVKDNNLESPYDLVKSGKWTLGKMEEMMSAVSTDLNGNGEVDSEDMFGIVTHSATYTPLLFGGGERIILKDKDNIPQLSISGNRFTSVFAKVAELMSNKKNICMAGSTKGTNTSNADWQKIFFNGRGLFFGEVLGSLKRMREMNSDFGLLPFPKYDETQKDYICNVLPSTTALGIPATVTQPDRSGLILEALAIESSNKVIPAYYDVALASKFMRDEESYIMLDIIRKNRIYELGTIYNLGDIGNKLSTMLAKNDTKIVSFAESISNQVNGAINKLIEDYK